MYNNISIQGVKGAIDLNPRLQTALGQGLITKIIEVQKNSTVDFVYQITVKIRNTVKNVYLKKYQEYPSGAWRQKKFMNFKIDPRRMSNEVKVINLLATLWGKDKVPQILYQDKKKSFIILSDVGANGEILSDELGKNKVHPEIGKVLGELLGKLHGTTYGKYKKWGESKSWEKSLHWVSHLWLTQNIKKFIAPEKIELFLRQSDHVKRSLIWGDAISKNIFVKTRGGVSCIDFDYSQIYDPAYDVGTLLAYWQILEIIGNKRVKKETNKFISDFQKAYNATLTKHHILKIDRVAILKRAQQWRGIKLVNLIDYVPKKHRVNAVRISKELFLR